MSDTVDISLRAKDEFSDIFKKYNASLKTADKGTKDLDVSTASLAGGSMSKLAVNSAMATTALLASVGITAKLTGNFLKLADSVAGLADDMGESAEKANVSSDFYQKMGGIAAKSGTDIGVLTASMRALTLQTTQATQGNKEAIDNYRKLGVTITDSKGAIKSQEVLFKDVVIALSEMPKGFERSSIAMKLLGRSSAELNTVLNQGSESLKKQLGSTSEYVTISKRLEEAGSNLKDRQIELNAVWDKTRNEALTPIIELMGDMTQEMIDFSKSKGVQDTVEVLKRIAENGSFFAKQWGSMAGVISGSSKKLEDSQAGYNERLREYNKLKNEIIELSKKDNRSDAEQKLIDHKKYLLKNIVGYEQRLRSAEREKEKAAALESLKAQKAEEERIKKESASKGTKKEAEKEFIPDNNTRIMAEKQWYKIKQDLADSDVEDAKKRFMVLEKSGDEHLEKMRESDFEDAEIRWNKKQDDIRKAQEFEIEANNAMKDSLMQSAQAGAEMFTAISSEKVAGINAEIEAVKKSSMTDKEKAKAIEELEKKRQKETQKSAKIQTAFNMSMFAATSAMAMVDAYALAIKVAKDQPGGIAARIAAGATGLAIGLGMVAQIKAAQASIAGAREFGGNVRAGGLYEVGERGDEMFTAGGKNYLLPSRSGTITPNNEITNSQSKVVNAVFNIYGASDANVTGQTIVRLLKEVDRDGSMDWNGMANLKRTVGA
jgi:hypothetical protein